MHTRTMYGPAAGMGLALGLSGCGDDTFHPGAGSNTVWVLTGIDTVVLAGRRADYTADRVIQVAFMP